MKSMTYAVILCMGRTGSTMLANLLSSHPDVEFHGELFGPGGEFESQDRFSRSEYLSHGAYRTNAKVKGFKMPFEWILRHPGVVEDFRALRYRAILLHRENVLAHLVSALLARARMSWDATQPYPVQRLRIDKWQLMHFAGYAGYISYDALPTLASGLDVHKTSYEAMLKEEQRASLLKFLGLDPMPLTTETIKGRDKTLAEVVENYDELKAFFAESPLASMFSEPAAP